MDTGKTESTGQDALLALLTERDLGVLATLKRDGRPQMSNVSYAYDPGRRLIRISVTADRAKTRNLARDPRASFHVTSADGWAWTVVEGSAELSPVAADPYDATVEELIEVYRAVRGEHPDWEDYRRAMVADRRLVVRLGVGRAYGQPLR
ncbi:MAG TPA: PPOX class F420-dependent oxidoreductase [Streptomyces sp.]|nr:PPOX class F420-dependent oxidoreductase [Streptomyces sp.]